MLKETKKRKITAKYVIGFENNKHCIYNNGCVVYEGNKIIYAGPNNKEEYSKLDTINGGNKILSPGLINLHCVSNIDIQNLLMKENIFKIQKDKYFCKNNNLSSDFFKISAKYSLANILKGGATTFCSVTSMAMKGYQDQIEQNWELVNETKKIGLRGYFANNYQDYYAYYKQNKKNYLYNEKEGQKGLKNAVDFSESINKLKDNKIKTFLFPYALENCSDNLLKQTKEFANDLGLTIRMHAAQYKEDFKRNLILTNKKPLKRLNTLGLLDEQLLIIHAIYLSSGKIDARIHKSDVRILKERNVNIGHCPKVYLRRGYGLNSLQKLISHNVNVGIGTDAYPQDMLNELTCASYLTKLRDKSGKSGNPRDIFNTATIGGAKALGCKRIGKIEKGSYADMILIDISKLESGIIDDPIITLVMNCNSSNIDTVIVNGKIIMQNKKIKDINEGKLIKDATEQWNIMKHTISKYQSNNKSKKKFFSQWINER